MPQSLPQKLIQSLQNISGFSEENFIKAHEEKPVTSIRFQPEKQTIFNQQSVQHLPFAIHHPVPWCPYGFYLQERPSFTFDPLFHAGLYYVQEASSQFLWEILKQIIAKNTVGKKVLDVCAAPGGKSTLLASYFNDGLVVANDVIKSRATILSENITRWGMDNVVVTNNDPGHFKRLNNFFDVLMIDAPCSGSGLFRKDNNAIGEWSEDAVNLCSARQQRIVADVYDCLQQNGVLIYSTCSYSQQENEDILDWMMDSFALSVISIQLKEEWKIVETQSPKHKASGYRFYPDQTKGEGFFIAAFIKNDGDGFNYPASQSLPVISKKETEAWLPWIKENIAVSFHKQNNLFIVMPPFVQQNLPLLQKNLYIKQAGIAVGEIKGKDVIPHHALAVSTLANSSLPTINFSTEQAIRFLQKKEIDIDVSLLPKGWCLAVYCGINLGWLKVLPNRINNYYPSEWRILKN